MPQPLWLNSTTLSILKLDKFANEKYLDISITPKAVVVLTYLLVDCSFYAREKSLDWLIIYDRNMIGLDDY